MKYWLRAVVAMMVFWINPAIADRVEARCDIYPHGSAHASKVIPCTFSQRQGYVTITREDGVTHDLSPVGDSPGNYLDQDGRSAYRQSGLGDQGLIFRLDDESIHVYWDTTALHPQGGSHPTENEQTDSEGGSHELAGTSWRLVKIMGMDDSVDAPEDRSLYTLAFGQDGRVAVLADCNRGAGSWISKSSSQLEFGPIAATRAMCQPGSISAKYLAQFQWVRSYVLKDEHLFLATMADGSIIELEPTE